MNFKLSEATEVQLMHGVYGSYVKVVRAMSESRSRWINLSNLALNSLMDNFHEIDAAMVMATQDYKVKSDLKTQYEVREYEKKFYFCISTTNSTEKATFVNRINLGRDEWTEMSRNIAKLKVCK